MTNFEDTGGTRDPAIESGWRAVVEAGFELMDHDPQAFFMKFERVSGEDWKGQKLDLTTWRDEVNFLTWILTGFATLRILLLGGLMVIVVVGIMNTMWMSVRERTREVGTLRAIGIFHGHFNELRCTRRRDTDNSGGRNYGDILTGRITKQDRRTRCKVVT